MGGFFFIAYPLLVLRPVPEAARRFGTVVVLLVVVVVTVDVYVKFIPGGPMNRDCELNKKYSTYKENLPRLRKLLLLSDFHHLLKLCFNAMKVIHRPCTKLVSAVFTMLMLLMLMCFDVPQLCWLLLIQKRP